MFLGIFSAHTSVGEHIAQSPTDTALQSAVCTTSQLVFFAYRISGFPPFIISEIQSHVQRMGAQVKRVCVLRGVS